MIFAHWTSDRRRLLPYDWTNRSDPGMNQDLGLTTDAHSKVPLYKQIAQQVASRIRAGTLPAGFRLPPTRILAKKLGTHRNTVVAAFEQLVEGGYIVSIVGRGTFVADVPEDAPAPRAASTSELPWSSLVSRATEIGSLQLVERLQRLVGSTPGPDLVNLQRMQPGKDLLPLQSLRRCLQHTMKTEGPDALGYAPREGLGRLREAVAADLGRRNIPAAADELLITTGSQQGLDLVARVLIDPGDTFLVQDATYTGAIHVLAAAGARLVGVPDDGEGPDMAALEQLAGSGAKGLYLMPNGQNPTGRSIGARRREELVAWSLRHGVPLVEDDYCADLDLDDMPSPPSLRALDSQVLHVGTFSKRLIPALRIGYVAFPPALRRHLTALKHAMDLGSSLLLQHALAEFLERGYLRTHLRRILPLYRDRRAALETGLQRHLPDGVAWTRARRGVTTWLSLPEGIDPEAAFTTALQHGVLVSPDVLFTVHGRERGLRLTFCAEPPRRISIGAKRLGKALASVLADGGRRSGTALTVV
jgi:DNA-binding transcriptional MocR family regulator